MILWNTKKLCDKISSNELSDYEKKNYLIVGTLFAFFLISVGYVFIQKSALHASIGFLLLGAITALGLQKTFEAYKPPSDTKISFLEFTIILGVPLGIKLFLVSLGLGFVAGIILALSTLMKWGCPPSALAQHITGQITEVVVVAWYYWRLLIHAKYISQKDAPSTDAPH